MMRVDEAANELSRVGKTVDEDKEHIAILNGLMQEYTIERRMLEGEAQAPSREHVRKSFTTNTSGSRGRRANMVRKCGRGEAGST